MVVVFKSRIRPGNEVVFQALADRMLEIAQSMPGIVSDKVYIAGDGERVSIHEWDSAEDLRAWREHPKHVAAQKLGGEEFFAEHAFHVCEDPRKSLTSPD